MLEIDDLEIRLGDTRITIPMLKVEKGNYLAIMGTTGAGKTVLLETIAGFHKPIRGRIILEGEDITELPPNKRGIAVVYQDFMLFPHMTVRRNIEYPLRVRGEASDERIEDIARILEIGNLLDRMPRTLSGGEMQRVAIARALITRPKILLMDEPFSSLDRRTRERVRRVVKDAIEDMDVTVVHITHDFETAWAMANKVAIMHGGKLLQFGEIEDIFSRPSGEFVAEFVDTNVLRGRVIGRKDGLTVVKVGEIEVYTADDASGEVSVSIRPENIILSRERFSSSMRNEFRGRIIAMNFRGSTVRITILVGDFSLVSVLTPNAVHALSLNEGDEVFVYFKASAVRVL